MQHYFAPTRLLDWSTDREVAIYFALTSDDCASPSVFVLQPCILNAATARLATPRPFPLHGSQFQYPDQYRSVDTILHRLPLAVIPDNVNGNDRIEHQSGTFTVHGANRSSIEELAPDSLFKISFDQRALHRDQPNWRPWLRKTKDLFPDKTGFAMTLIDEHGLKPSPEKRIEQTLREMWRHDHEQLLAGGGKAPYVPGISGCLVDDLFIEREEAVKLKRWLVEEPSRLAVVSGAAASGKTNLLVNVVLKDNYYGSQGVLFFSLNTYAPRDRSLIQCLATFLETVPSARAEPIDVGVLEGMIRDGRIVLILDAVDELARLQGEHRVETLKDELSRFVRDGSPRIIVACRDHILRRLVDREILEATDQTRQIPLKKIDTAEISRRLIELDPNVQIAPEALDIIAEVPLFYGVLFRTLQDGGYTIRKITTKADFWRAWLTMASEKAHLEISEGTLLRQLGTIATQMLVNRDDFLSETDFGDHQDLVVRLAPTLVDVARDADDAAIKLAQTCPVFVREANNKWRFIHQAIREFTLAWNVNDGFENRDADTVLTATGSLDYESAETYLYLLEMLPEGRLDHIIKELGLNIYTADDEEKCNNFLRNYFEAVGMLGASEPARSIAIRQAIATIQAPPDRILFRTKYNAARCLARLHPTAPPVYCKYVMKSRPQIGTGIDRYLYGFAVRGFNRREHAVSDRPPEAFTTAAAHHDAARAVTECLVNTIRELALVHELHPDGVFLRINCAHALIRWLDITATALTGHVRELAYSSKTDRRVRANLFLALHDHGERIPNADVLLKVSRRPPGLTVNLEALPEANAVSARSF